MGLCTKLVSCRGAICPLCSPPPSLSRSGFYSCSASWLHIPICSNKAESLVQLFRKKHLQKVGDRFDLPSTPREYGTRWLHLPLSCCGLSSWWFMFSYADRPCTMACDIFCSSFHPYLSSSG